MVTGSSAAPDAAKADAAKADAADRDREIATAMRTPEPWWRSIFHAAKSVVLSVGVMAGLDHALFAEPLFDAEFYSLISTFFFGQSILERRRGRFSGATLGILGGGFTGLGLLFAGGALFLKDSLMSMMSVPTLVLGGLMLWGARRDRREAEERFRQLENPEPAPGAITRGELNRCLDAVNSATRGQGRWVAAAFVGTLGGTLAILTLGERFSWPDWTALGGLIWLWGGIGGITWWSARTSARMAKECGLECPACTRPYHGAFVSSRAQHLLDTLGRCPRCAARVIIEEH